MKLWCIGEVGIDSGHIIILDPGMVETLQEFEWFTGDHQWKQVEFPSAVSIHTGDGDYKIYAVLDNSEGPFQVVGIFIHTDPDISLPFEQMIAEGQDDYSSL